MTRQLAYQPALLDLPMDPHEPTVVTRLFLHMAREARRTGKDHRITLQGGAEMVVRVREGLITLTIKRTGAVVGIPEEWTFRRDCRVPEGAERVPDKGLGERDGVYYVGFRWPDEVRQ